MTKKTTTQTSSKSTTPFGLHRFPKILTTRQVSRGSDTYTHPFGLKQVVDAQHHVEPHHTKTQLHLPHQLSRGQHKHVRVRNMFWCMHSIQIYFEPGKMQLGTLDTSYSTSGNFIHPKCTRARGNGGDYVQCTPNRSSGHGLGHPLFSLSPVA